MSAAAAALLAAGLVCGCANPQKEGVEALEEGNYEEAEARFSELTEKGGKEGAAGYRGLGMVYYETEEYQKALEAFETAAESGIRPDVQMYNLMAVCHADGAVRTGAGIYPFGTGTGGQCIRG